uniref:NAD(P)(+)--arginine ADP-ribosyltransferase n=1 Tax=Calidris pygmaea TaxID=425635 RepID=A0A8C3PQR5_9CHAR
MENLVLGLVLLAWTLATGNSLNLKVIGEKVLDMAPNSFDDQYQGCDHEMEEELGELHRTEFTNNSIYAGYWTQAAEKWKEHSHVPQPPMLRTEHAVALIAYSLPGSLNRIFNKAVREVGRSHREYMEKFQFKTLHFLLTQALKILREAQPQQCYQVYRGIRDIRFTAQSHDSVRFGQFASSSILKDRAERFGTVTFFSVYTCYGVPIKNFSDMPEEEEVLIPPFETFTVTNITYDGKTTHIQLESTGTCSNHNCEWLKGDIPRDGRAPWGGSHHRSPLPLAAGPALFPGSHNTAWSPPVGPGERGGAPASAPPCLWPRLGGCWGRTGSPWRPVGPLGMGRP